MRERGRLDSEVRVEDVLRHKSDKEFFTVSPKSTVREAFQLMKDHELSQLPVVEGEEVKDAVS